MERGAFRSTRAGGPLGKLYNMLLGGAIAAALAAAPVAPMAPAFAAGSYPCEADTSSTVGRQVSFSGLPPKLVAGEDLVVEVSIDCPGSVQAVLAGMNLRFVNDQNLATTFTPRTAELLSTSGTVKTYRVSVPTGEGRLPEGRQVLVHSSLVMERVPERPSGVRQPRYTSNSRDHAPEELNLPGNLRMVLWHPTHSAPNPQLPWALLAETPAEIRMPAWGAGAELAYRWESADGGVLSTGRNFVPNPDTEGSVRVVVTGTWPDGSVSERSSGFAEVRQDIGGFTDVALSGKAVPYGGSVTARTSGNGKHPGGRWYAISATGSHTDTPVPNDPSETSATLVPGSGDVGKRFQYIIGGHRSRGASGIVTVTAAPPPGDRRTGFVHENVMADTTAQLTKHLQPGYRLTAADPWPGGTTGYRWYRDGVLVPKATGKSYVLGVSDAGRTLQAAVATNLPGFSPNEVRTSTVKVPWVNLKAADPKFTGAARVGTKLQASTPGWTAGTTFSYQWLRNGTAIKGASKSAYTIGPEDHGKILTLRVTGKKPSHTTATRTSAPTPLVNYGKLVTAAPTLSGTARVGKTLTARTGTWSPGTKFRYQWYSNGKAIKGSTKSTLRLGSAHRSKKISVKVSGSKAGYMGTSRASKAVLVKR